MLYTPFYFGLELAVKKNRDQSEADRAGEQNDADARFTGEKKRVDDLVAASLTVMQAAMTVMDTDMKEADRLIDDIPFKRAGRRS